MTWRERERLLYLGSTFSLLPALTIVPAFASLVFQPSIPHATLWAFVLFPLLIVAEFFGVYKLVQSCVARPFTLLTMLSFGAFFVLLVIAVYTGVFLAALADRM
ncbi:MAG TPA: hypothetical protein VFA40_19190 [Terriglobales bacterium]|jgi:multidrug efflux pump subunit AcrB|nr:hypothetical protein [Terriglobales bacterium]